MKQLILTIIIALFASAGFAQPPKKIAFEKYNVAEGLPEEYVISLIQDDKGFIWAATQNGLVKYDGYQFKVYKVSSDTSQTTKLQIRHLAGGILKTKDGKIWIGGFNTNLGAVASFDPVLEQFRNYFPEMINGSRWTASFLLLEDAHQNIWFGNLSELKGNKIIANLCRLNPLDGTIKIYPDLLNLNTFLLPVIKNTEALDSTVWMLDTKSNLKKWNLETDSFEIVIPGGKPITASDNQDTIRSISKAGNNRLLINGDHTFCVYDSQKHVVIKSYERSAAKPAIMAPGNIMSVGEDQEGHYWLMHKGGNFTRIHPETNQSQIYEYGKGHLIHDVAPESPSDAFILSHQNKNGIWFHLHTTATRRPCFLYFDFATNNFTFYNHEFNQPRNGMPSITEVNYNITEDQTGLLWLYTWPGMYKQSPKKKQMELFRHQLGLHGSIPSDTINYLFEDSKKRLWIGTRKGLAVYQPDTNNFRIFRHNSANSASISHNNITAILEDADGKIWVGTENGLNQWQESTGTFKRFFFSPNESNYCLELFSDKQQRLWLSLRNKGVFVFDKSTGKVLKSYVPDVNNHAAITTKGINNIYQDFNGNIWFGTSSRSNTMAGLFRLNKAEDGFFHYLPIPGDSSSISDRVIFLIAEDEKKRLWIGTNQGLNLYEPEKDHFTVFFDNTINCITGFCLDHNGEPWFGTYAGSGLVSVDLQNQIITAYDESKGLLHNDISMSQSRRIAVDDYGRFWLPTQRGLSVFDPESKSFVSYLEKDGFQPYDANYISCKTRNGDIWIGSNNGLNRIVPSDLLKKDTTLPSIVITQVTINDSLYSIPDGNIFKKSVAYTNDFQVKYWQKDISFEFVALHYLRPEDNLYSWKLENYDKDWSVPSKERKASYTNLSPGDYIFRVKASNADGVWNEEGISITFTILPPWWHTWLAYIVYAVLFIAALRSYSIWRERNLRLEKEHLQVKVEERTSELKKSIEEIKSTQAQLIQSEKMASLGQLTAGIAHEIQNPLNFVNNFSEVNAELIEEALAENDKGNHSEVKSILSDLKENESKIIHHGKRAESIVKGMLLHSRGNSGHKEPTDINALCDEFLRLSYHGFRAKDKSFNADYKLEADTSLPKIEVVPQDIGRVLLNLINNAFYAVDKRAKLLTPPPPEGGSKNFQTDYKPTVTISTASFIPPSGGPRGVRVVVKDNGEGIPANIVDKIFQPFFTTKPTGQGTGLGLSLAYDIVKAHGGELRVKTKEGEARPDDTVGRGTEFIIEIPIKTN